MLARLAMPQRPTEADCRRLDRPDLDPKSAQWPRLKDHYHEIHPQARALEAQRRKVISDWRETAFKTVTAEGLFFAAGRAASPWTRRPGGRS
jgi:hypothetical protein